MWHYDFVQFSADQNKESGFCRFKPVFFPKGSHAATNVSTRTKNLERQQHLLIIINELCNTWLFIHASVFAQSHLHNSPVLVKACILYGTCGSAPLPFISSLHQILCLVRTSPPPSSRQQRLLVTLEPRAKHIFQPQSAECSMFKNTFTLHTKRCSLQSRLPMQSQSCRWRH